MEGDLTIWEAGQPVIIDSTTKDVSTFDGGQPYVYIAVETTPTTDRRIFIID